MWTYGLDDLVYGLVDYGSLLLGFYLVLSVNFLTFHLEQYRRMGNFTYLLCLDKKDKGCKAKSNGIFSLVFSFMVNS